MGKRAASREARFSACCAEYRYRWSVAALLGLAGCAKLLGIEVYEGHLQPPPDAAVTTPPDMPPSTEAGATPAVVVSSWKAMNRGLYGATVSALAVDPAHPATVYAAARDTGAWKTTDAGQNWRQIVKGLPARRSLISLAVDPITTNSLYALSDAGVIYRSIDAGEYWYQAFASPDLAGPIAIDPVHSGTVYVGGFRALVRSSDGGLNWQPLSVDASYGSGIRSMAIHPSTGQVWAATYGDGVQTMAYGGTGLTLVGDGSATSLQAGHSSCCYYTAIAFDPGNSDTIYVSNDSQPNRMHRSLDGGSTWAPIENAPIADAFVGFRPPGALSVMYAAGRDGVYRMDNGVSWIRSISADRVKGLAIDPFLGTVYAQVGSGISKSPNGQDWASSVNGITGNPVLALASAPQRSRSLQVALKDRSLFHSSDAGDSWSPPSVAADTGDILAIAVDSVNPDLIFAVGATGPWQSLDGGVSWARSTEGIPTLGGSAIAASPSSSGTFYSSSGSSVYVSHQGVTQWMMASTGLPAEGVTALAVDPRAAEHVYAGLTISGVFQTRTAGASWEPLGGLPTLRVTSVALDPSTPGKLLVGTDQGLWIDRDGLWSQPSGDLATAFVTDVGVAPSQPQTIYAGTQESGVFRSDDGGSSWQNDSAGLSATAVMRVLVDPNDPYRVYVGTWDGGVFGTQR